MMPVKFRAVIAVLLSLLFCTNYVFARKHKHVIVEKVDAKKLHWVDSVYNHLTEEERIGQLFMVAAYSGGKNYNEDLVTKLLAAHQIGGLIFMQGGPLRQAAMTNQYQQMAQVPLLIGMDGEWGLGMRLDSVKDMPRQMMLGAANDTNLVFHMASAVARQCKRIGVHIDFAPDVDVNNNPANPIINFRSFGEDKTKVSRLGIAYMRGLQQNGIIACAKHFPGHGDTNVDSHKDLPVINKSLAQLDTLELYPFKQMIAAGVKSIMIAHLSVPALETEPHVPTTLSRNTVTNLLKIQMGFKGLIFTDALNMKGVTKYFQPGEADLRAFMAGNDVLLFSQDVPTAIAKIKNALDSGLVQQADLEISVRKILAAKYDAGLANWKPISLYHLTEDLNQYTNAICTDAAKESITLLRDDNGIIDKINRNMRVGYVGVLAGTLTTTSSPLHAALSDALGGGIQADWLPEGEGQTEVNALLDKIKDNDATIVAIHDPYYYPHNNYNLDEAQLAFLEQVQTRSNVMIVLMGNAYILQDFCKAPSVMVAYEDDTITENITAKALLRKLRATGRMPVSPCMNIPAYVAGTIPPFTAKPAELVKTEFVQDAGIKTPDALYKLDMFIQRCIADGVFPGCRVFAAKDGKVFYDKSFGYFKYNKIHPVDSNTMYDMASCTKVLATTLAVMRLYETGKLDLDKTIGDYLPMARNTDKAKLLIRDILLHQAGLRSWIPFYKKTLDANGNLRADLYRQTGDDEYNIPVAKDLFMRHDYIDTMWAEILKSPLENKGRYVYSDLDFYFLAAIVKQITGEPINEYADEQFYEPMGLKHITYNPLQNGFSVTEIPPTEFDVEFRHELIDGYVHDPGAAMLGGVAGHAGIFATAGNVAAIFQMLQNKGVYNGKRYFKAATVNYFTAYNTKLSRRGLGFDKPVPDADDGGPAGERCSGYAFGHQGFTGTCVWADPGTGVVFVFLSNRVYPSATDNKINHLNVRTIVQDYLYEALGIPVNHDRAMIYKEDMAKLK